MPEVRLPTYAVTVERGALNALGDTVRQVAPAHRYAIVSDSQVAPLYAARVSAQLKGAATVFTFAAGEANLPTMHPWILIALG